jgi:hypothetical protein
LPQPYRLGCGSNLNELWLTIDTRLKSTQAGRDI